LKLRKDLGACSPTFINFLENDSQSQYQWVEIGFDSPNKKKIALQMLDYMNKTQQVQTQVLHSDAIAKNTKPKSEKKKKELVARPSFSRPEASGDPSKERTESIDFPEISNDTDSDNDDEDDDEEGVIFVYVLFFFFFPFFETTIFQKKQKYHHRHLAIKIVKRVMMYEVRTEKSHFYYINTYKKKHKQKKFVKKNKLFY
ncbi:hypothetical protein RFI_25308, partial [Reticulomyxa filosa]